MALLPIPGHLRFLPGVLTQTESTTFCCTGIGGTSALHRGHGSRPPTQARGPLLPSDLIWFRESMIAERSSLPIRTILKGSIKP